MTHDLALKICKYLKINEGAQTKQGIDQLQKLYNLFLKVDAAQIEINPWAVTPDGDLYCVDAKVQIDENAHFRQKRLVDMMKNSQATEAFDPNEK